MKEEAKKIKPIPAFKNEDEEREFWSVNDINEYYNADQPIFGDFSNLKTSTKPITIRLPESMIASLKTLANKRDVPYQSLLKILLWEKIDEELKEK